MKSNWPEFVLPEVAFFQEGPGLRKWQWTNSGMKVINVTNILGDGRVDVGNTDRFISQEEFDQKYRHFAIQPRDILVASSGNTYGKVGRIHADQLPVMMNTSVIRFHSADRSKLNDDFLYAFLRSPFFKTQVEAFVIGSAQPNFGPTHIKRMKIRLPPLDIQRRIADILSAYDDLIEVNTRRITVLEEMARRLFDEWFVRFNFPGSNSNKVALRFGRRMPEGWSLRSFSDAAEVLSGGTPRKAEPSFWNGDIPFFTPSDARQRVFATGTADHITDAGLTKCASQLFEAWTVFITARGTVGRVLMAAQPMAMNQSCYALRGKDGYPQTFVYELALQAAAAFKQKAHGAVFDTIVKDTFDKHDVLLPPVSLAKDYDRIAHSIYDDMLVCLRQNSCLRTARDLLLPKLISGEIDLSSAERQAKRAGKREAAE